MKLNIIYSNTSVHRYTMVPPTIAVCICGPPNPNNQLHLPRAPIALRHQSACTMFPPNQSFVVTPPESICFFPKRE